ncbi:trypsin-like peptidase domain-containing protein [Streptomyces sp. NPDC089919]|uniref:trypsin-like serine peptidase n=1 Tax=Streptomyces sp. NPDC089919 TaxID=3155188 RepID=UPI0034147166
MPRATAYRPRPLRSAAVGALALALLAGATGAAASEPRPEPVRPAADDGWSAARAAAYWTPQRMAAAQPVDGPPAPRSQEAAAPAAGTAGAPGVGRDFGGLPQIGRMYLMRGTGAYFCTASVIASPRRSLVLTAGHCLDGGSRDQQLAFVPQYTQARPQPHGVFPVLRSGGANRIWIDPRYRSLGHDRAAGLDVAFVEVARNAAGRRVQDAVGADRLLLHPGYAHKSVRLIGHPGNKPVPRTCTNATSRFTSTDRGIPGSFLRIDCTGYPGGTSGGPFLAHYDPATRTGDVIGIIGGYKTGGTSPDTSFSPYFGQDIARLFALATAPVRS